MPSKCLGQLKLETSFKIVNFNKINRDISVNKSLSNVVTQTHMPPRITPGYSRYEKTTNYVMYDRNGSENWIFLPEERIRNQRNLSKSEVMYEYRQCIKTKGSQRLWKSKSGPKLQVVNLSSCYLRLLCMFQKTERVSYNLCRNQSHQQECDLSAYFAKLRISIVVIIKILYFNITA